jgi:hypothetical protein
MSGRRVLVVSNDHVGQRMAGPAIRSYHFAKELSRSFSVTLATPNEPDIAVNGVRLVTAAPTDARVLTRLALEHDAVVSQRLPISTALRLAGSDVRVVYLYAPVTLELLAFASGEAASL